MADKSWKAFERSVARLLGGVRRGADTRGPQAGKCDIIVSGMAPECALLSKPSFASILHKCKQAEMNAGQMELPIAIVKRKGDRVRDALVCMRLEEWLRWYGP